MTLDNLVGSSLENVTPDREAVQRLLEAAERSLNDAQLSGLSAEGRFDIAYKAVMQSANAALQANGFRTPTGRPGHHQTMIQTLPKSIGLDAQKMVLLDKLRRQRNAIDYSGDLVSDSMADACFMEATSLLNAVRAWLAQSRPEFC
jgi:hypothetical protein